MKQIGLGIAQYTQDYDERYPMIRNYGGEVNKRAWDGQIEPYLGIKVAYSATASAQIFVCPSDSITGTTAGSVRRTYSMPWNNISVSTGSTTDPYIGGVEVGSSYITGRALSEVISPATTLMIVERPFNQNAFGAEVGSACSGPNNQTGTTPTYLGRPIHFDGYNYLFIDGHVKFQRPEQTVGTGTLAAPKGMWTLADND